MTCGVNDNCEPSPAGSCLSSGGSGSIVCACNRGWTGAGTVGTCMGKHTTCYSRFSVGMT